MTKSCPNPRGGGAFERLRSKLTYANVVATLALFIALAGGTAVAAITGTKVKDGAITGSKIALSSLPTVPGAAHADAATSAQNAANARPYRG